jgi:hypothetical protein
VQFFAVNEDVDVAPLEKFTSAEKPARYAPIRQEQHISDEVGRAEENARQTESVV